MQTKREADHMMLATVTMVALAVEAALLGTGLFLTLGPAEGRLVNVMERQAFGVMFMPIGAVFIQHVAAVIYRVDADLPSAGWVSVAMAATAGMFAAYALTLGNAVALEADHLDWAALLSAGATAAMAVCIGTATLTLRRAWTRRTAA